MVHFWTFLKTFFWTLIVIVVLGGGFWLYIRFFNQDLAQSIASVIYRTQECPICADTCTLSGKVLISPIGSGMAAIIPESSNLENNESTTINENLTTKIDSIDTKITQILDIVKTPNSSDNTTPTTNPTTTNASGVTVGDLLKRIQELENKTK